LNAVLNRRQQAYNEPALTAIPAKVVLDLSEKHSLTVYDAAYLELGYRRQLALGTLNSDLRKAAEVDGLALL
jgi:predicted nucleic acid-binding protein